MSSKSKRKQQSRNFGSFEKLNMLEEGRFLLEGNQCQEAIDFAESAVKKYPSEVQFWEILAAAGSQLKISSVMQNSFAQLTKLQPNDPQNWFGLAFSFAMDEWIALAYRGFRDFLARFPNSDKIADARDLMKMAEKDLRSFLAGFGFPEGDEGLELACMHEELQVLMYRREFEKATSICKKLLVKMPNFGPAQNNLSLILFANGDANGAFEIAQKLLEKEPENYHALANLVQFSVFLGKNHETQLFVERLNLIKTKDSSIWAKKIEAFTFSGDDALVVESYKEANKTQNSALLDSLCKHLAAVAFCRLGNEKDASKIWREVLKNEPDFSLANENFDELILPENERNIFALPINYWIPTRYLSELDREVKRVKNGRNFEKQLSKTLAKFFADNPNMINVLSVLLERGEESAKEFAIDLMDLARTPESLDTLKDFAFSERGPDKMRYKAAMALSKSGVISNKARLWNNGEWREMMLLVFEITGDKLTDYPLKPKGEQMLRKGVEVMLKGNDMLAEDYFLKALDTNGDDHPSILYNLLAIKQKNSPELATDELRELVRKFPEYSFAAISLATIEIKNGNIELAKKLVEKLYDKKKWHYGEMKPWFHFNLELALAEKQFASARISLEMMQQFDEDLDVEYWEDLITRMELVERVSNRPRKVFGRKKKR